jgi:hypothetical protein
MSSKSKAARLNQRGYWESKLEHRLNVMVEKGLEPIEVSKDSNVRKIRAKIRKTNTRLKAISALEKKTEEMARVKSEKAAAPKEKKGNKKTDKVEAPEMSKRQQKKKKKKESKEKEE